MDRVDYIYTTNVFPKETLLYIFLYFIEDYIDDEKDVIMEVTPCIARDIVLTTYRINASVPKQADYSPEYRIRVC